MRIYIVIGKELALINFIAVKNNLDQNSRKSNEIADDLAQ